MYSYRFIESTRASSFRDLIFCKLIQRVTDKLCFVSAPSLIFLFLLISSSQICFAHGDLDERIAATTQEIEMTPDSAFLYFKRGKLYYEHQEYTDALKDLEQADKLGYKDFYCDLVFAKSYQKIEHYNEALRYVNKVLAQDESKVITIKIKASILFDQKKYKASALEYEKLIKKSIKTLPENYIAASMAWELLNTEEGKKKSVDILEKGIEDLGPLFSFYNRIKEIHISNSSYQDALNVQIQIIDLSNRKETGYFKAAKICMLLKENNNAQQYLNLSLEAIKKLPARIKGNKSMRDLKLQIENTKTQL